MVMGGSYTFRWSRGYVVYLVFLFAVEFLLLAPFVALAVGGVCSVFLLAVAMLFPAIWGVWICALLKHNVCRVEVHPGRITVVRVVGKPLCWDNVQEVRTISGEWLKVYATKRNTNYKDLDVVFGMRNAYYTAPSIGEFERISNNLDELALVTLADGGKYVINYPRDLFDGEPVAETVG